MYNNKKNNQNKHWVSCFCDLIPPEDESAKYNALYIHFALAVFICILETLNKVF